MSKEMKQRYPLVSNFVIVAFLLDPFPPLADLVTRWIDDEMKGEPDRTLPDYIVDTPDEIRRFLAEQHNDLDAAFDELGSCYDPRLGEKGVSVREFLETCADLIERAAERYAAGDSTGGSAAI